MPTRTRPTAPYLPDDSAFLRSAEPAPAKARGPRSRKGRVQRGKTPSGKGSGGCAPSYEKNLRGRVGGPSQRRNVDPGSPLALLPGRLFHPPFRAPRIVSAPSPRLFPRCFARHSIRSCAARFQPAFAIQPPSCGALPAPKPRFESKLRRELPRFDRDSTSKLHRAFPGPGQAFSGTAGRGKNAQNGTKRIEWLPAPHAERVGVGLQGPRARVPRPSPALPPPPRPEQGPQASACAWRTGGSAGTPPPRRRPRAG